MITIDKIKSNLKKKNSGSLLDNAPNYLVGYVIQKRVASVHMIGRRLHRRTCVQVEHKRENLPSGHLIAS